MRPMNRCPFSLSRLVKVTKTGQVVYKAEKDACRHFPDSQGDGMAAGPQREVPEVPSMVQGWFRWFRGHDIELLTRSEATGNLWAWQD